MTSDVLWDVTEELYQNRKYTEKFYSDFEGEINIPKELKPNREEFHNTVNEVKKEYKKPREYNVSNSYQQEFGYCIRTGVKILFDPQRPFCLEAYRSWAAFENWNYRENYCHKTGRESNGRTSMAKPLL